MSIWWAASVHIVMNEVKGFMKKQSTVTVMYKAIRTRGNNTIKLSEDHLIYARKTSADKYSLL